MTPIYVSMRRTPAAFNLCSRLASGLLLAAAALLGACGGGGGGDTAAGGNGGTAGVGTGGTGAFTLGTVTGFGSIFVNGIRYRDEGARLVDEDGRVTVVGVNDNPLKVGMAVEVQSRIDDNGAARTATQIEYGSEIKGPVTEVNAAAGTFKVFGITVRVTATTVFENFGGVTAVAVGNVVEVHGQPDTGGRIVATYVEREAISVAAFIAGNGEYRLRGAVVGLSGAVPTYTFAVRGVAIRTDARTAFDGVPVEGASVRVRLNPTQQADGRYTAERLRVRNASYEVSSASPVTRAEVEGYVVGFSNASAAFQVGGYPVRLSPAVTYEDGSATNLKNGVRVEVKGNIDNGVLVVTTLEFESRDDDGDGNDDEVSGGSTEVEFRGAVACVSCGAASGSFTIRGATVSYGANTEFRDGLSGSTLNGRSVRVKTVIQVTSTGTAYRATRIEVDS